MHSAGNCGFLSRAPGLRPPLGRLFYYAEPNGEEALMKNIPLNSGAKRERKLLPTGARSARTFFNAGDAFFRCRLAFEARKCFSCY